MVVLLVVSDVMVCAVSKTPGSKSPLLSSVCRRRHKASARLSGSLGGRCWRCSFALRLYILKQTPNSLPVISYLVNKRNPLGTKLLKKLDESSFLSTGSGTGVDQRREEAV